jgi:PmbA protein
MAERLIEVAGKAVQSAMKKDADQAEAIACSIGIMTINIENGATRFSGLDQHQGIGLRVVKDSAIGFSFVSNILDESIDSIVTRALKVSSVKKSDPNFKSLSEPKAPTEVEGTFDDDIANLSFEDAKGLASRIAESAESYHEGIMATFGVFESKYKKFAVVNSLGVEVANSGTSVLAGVRTLLEYSGGTSNGLAFQNSRKLKGMDPEDIGERSSKLAVTSVKPRRIKTLETTVILDPDAVAGLFGGVLMPALYGSVIQEKGSFLLDKLSEEVASEAVTVVDDGTLPGGIKTARVDYEGVPTRRTTLIEGGILKDYMFDTYSADKDGIESTGNAVRAGGFGPYRDMRGREYRFAPRIGCTNFVMEKGSTSRERMIEEVDDGILVTFAVGGGSASSGEFSADARNVYRIEGGEITYPIRQAIFAGNMMGLLKNVDAVGDVPRSSGGLNPGEIISPSIRTRKGLIIGDL